MNSHRKAKTSAYRFSFNHRTTVQFHALHNRQVLVFIIACCRDKAILKVKKQHEPSRALMQEVLSGMSVCQESTKKV